MSPDARRRLRDKAGELFKTASQLRVQGRYAEAADHLSVVADVWEELGESARAEASRVLVSKLRSTDFRAKHTYISHGFFRVSDREAGRLARASNAKLPKYGRPSYVVVRLGSGGPQAELHRTPYDRRYHSDAPKRGWVYAVYVGFRS